MFAGGSRARGSELFAGGPGRRNLKGGECWNRDVRGRVQKRSLKGRREAGNRDVEAGTDMLAAAERGKLVWAWLRMADDRKYKLETPKNVGNNENTGHGTTADTSCMTLRTADLGKYGATMC